QNMSLNSVVTRDGAEIGRAQAMQAAAAGIEPEAALNPVLLKPGGNGTSQVMVLGQPVAEADALSYPALKPRLAQTVLGCLAGRAGSTRSSARARAARRRSTCASTTSPTWAWPARRACR